MSAPVVLLFALGGLATVLNTEMVFFPATLLAGYRRTSDSTSLAARQHPDVNCRHLGRFTRRGSAPEPFHHPAPPPVAALVSLGTRRRTHSQVRDALKRFQQRRNPRSWELPGQSPVSRGKLPVNEPTRETSGQGGVRDLESVSAKMLELRRRKTAQRRGKGPGTRSILGT